MKAMPFRLRIALLSALVSGTVMVAFSTAAWLLLYRERLSALDREIRGLAYRHPGWMAGRANYERLASTIELIFGEDRKEQLLLLVRDATGQIRYRSEHWPADWDSASLDFEMEDAVSSTRSATNVLSTRPELEPVTGQRRGPPWGFGGGMGRLRGGPPPAQAFSKAPRFWSARTPATTWRLGMFGDGGDRLVIGLDCVDLQGELDRMRLGFLIALPLVLLIIGSGGWWVAGHAVRPLRSVAQVAEKITARGLGQRIPPSSEDPEITRLIRVLNLMMDRLEASFHQATRFSADASHELKTPLAVMQGELENALQSDLLEASHQRLLANLLEEVQRLKSITQSLLLLARADAGQLPLLTQRLDLGQIVAELMEDLEVLAEQSKILVQPSLSKELWVQADPSLLRHAILNVLQNALRYNEPDGWVRIHATRHQGQPLLTICNSGPGIPAEDQAKLFERFFRGDPSRGRHRDGVGLGLSIAREIVRAHGGSLELKESRPGCTCFTLSLPHD